MDYTYDNNGRPRANTRSNGFANAAMILGICALLSTFTMTLIPPIVFGSLSLIFGILSKGYEKQMHSYALVGVITASCSLVINFVIAGAGMYLVFSDPAATREYIDSVNETYQQMTGMSLEEILQNYGIDSDLSQ